MIKILFYISQVVGLCCIGQSLSVPKPEIAKRQLDSYGSPAAPVQTSNQYSATPVQQNQDSYGSPSGPVQVWCYTRVVNLF